MNAPSRESSPSEPPSAAEIGTSRAGTQSETSLLRTDAWRMAARIFRGLLQNGSLSRTRDSQLCRRLDDDEVREAVGVLEEEFGLRLLVTSSEVFLSPALDNELFGFSNQELRQRLKAKTNNELALACFAVLAMLSMFYRGEGFDIKSRDFVTIEEWCIFLTGKLQFVRDSGMAADGRDDLRLNMPGILKAWEDVMTYDETKVRHSMADNNQIALLSRVMKFLADENLIHTEQDRIISPTPRLDAIMRETATGDSRKAELAAFFSACCTAAEETGAATGEPSCR